MNNVVIVGSGIAGDEAAFAAKKTDPGAKVTLITRDPYPLYSACVLADYIAEEIPKERVFLKKAADYEDAGIELLLSTSVEGIKPQISILQLQNRELVYDKLILAPGSRSFVPPIPGADKKGVFVLKTLFDADSIKNAAGKNAVIVGSGPVGIEACIALRKQNYSVVLIELENNILPTLFDKPMSKSLKELLEENGIKVKTGERVVEIIGKDNVERIKTDKDIIDCDVAVLVVGMRPEVTIAEEAGLEIGETGGIKVNNAMETGKANIFACGDCVESSDRVTGKKGLYMLWSNAKIQGRVAGINAAGGNMRYPGSISITTVNIYDKGAAAVGNLAGSFEPGLVDVIHRKNHKGELWLILKGDELTGAQAIGSVDIIGSLLKIFFNSNKKINSSPGRKSQMLELWSLRGLSKEINKIIEI